MPGCDPHYDLSSGRDLGAQCYVLLQPPRTDHDKAVLTSGGLIQCKRVVSEQYVNNCDGGWRPANR